MSDHTLRGFAHDQALASEGYVHVVYSICLQYFFTVVFVGIFDLILIGFDFRLILSYSESLATDVT